MKKGDVGMAKHFSKKYRNKGWSSITLYLQSEINFCSVDAWCYIPTSLLQKQGAKIKFFQL